MKMRGGLATAPLDFSDADRADTTSTVANWVLDRHFANKDFCRAIQEN